MSYLINFRLYIKSMVNLPLFGYVCLCVCDDRMTRVLDGSRLYCKWFWRGV